jgi:hypothetical protein
VVSVELPPTPVVTSSLAYGHNGSILTAADSHHRLLGTVAVAASLARWLAASLAIVGRHDEYAIDALRDDASQLGARLTFRLVAGDLEQLRVALQPSLWSTGKLDGLSGDLLLAVGRRLGTLTISAQVGYRHDRSALALANPMALSPSDRLAAGASDFDAILLGVAAARALGGWELWGELGADMLVGAGAPSPTESPLRALGGLRRRLGALTVGLALHCGLSEYPRLTASSALTPVEPRLGALASFSVALGRAAQPSRGAPAQPVAVAPPPAGDKGRLRGRVLADGKPIAGAIVRLGDSTVLTTGADGLFVAELVPGTHEIAVEREGFDSQLLRVAVGPASELPLEIPLVASSTQGSFRGTVLSETGKSVPATVSVPALGRSANVDADGQFELPLPEGTYEVLVSCPKFAPQMRKIKVQAGGVTILNVELRAQRQR